jgi:predicted DNA-binding helix-hairpin-helix protein
VREHRLYQADWLMRRYGFEASELTSEDDRDLDLTRDPKLAWALRNRGFFPVDVNTAPREALLRVPGLGYRNVRRILQMRRHHRVTLADLVKLRAITERARPFLVTADFDPQTLLLDSPKLEVKPAETQLSLFAAAVAGEL